MVTYGEWTTERKLGVGGQGTVYLARRKGAGHDRITLRNELRAALSALTGTTDEVGLDRNVERLAGLVRQMTAVDQGPVGALKVLLPFADDDVRRKASLRLERELAVLQKIKHPNLISLLDSDPDHAWFVMDYYPRGPLSDHLIETRGDVVGALRRFRPLVAAVAALHAEETVHRDIKPDNVFVNETDGLVLGDCGLAIRMENETRLTDTYENAGSRDWMPAWAMGMRLDEITPAFDVFSLGKVLWSMVAGKPKLRLWYHRRPEFELARIFPENDLVPWIQEVLDKTVVQDEADCLKNATVLLSLIDRTVAAIEVGGRSMSFGPGRKCRACGIGRYELRFDNERPSSIRNFGMSPTGTNSFKAFACSHCGHVDLFFFESGRHRPAWEQHR
jgi:serine/threonine protein kinase